MNQLKMAVAYVLCVVTAGIIGFVSIEHLPWLDAIYLTITTITTVGYGDVVPATTAGKIFIILFMICGVVTAGYTLTLIMSIIIGAEFSILLLSGQTAPFFSPYISSGMGNLFIRLLPLSL